MWNHQATQGQPNPRKIVLLPSPPPEFRGLGCGLGLWRFVGFMNIIFTWYIFSNPIQLNIIWQSQTPYFNHLRLFSLSRPGTDEKPINIIINIQAHCRSLFSFLFPLRFFFGECLWVINVEAHTCCTLSDGKRDKNTMSWPSRQNIHAIPTTLIG